MRENLALVYRQDFYPLRWISWIMALITPTRVQLSIGPVKYDTPLLTTSWSIFRTEDACRASKNNVAEIRSRVFGFVILQSWLGPQRTVTSLLAYTVIWNLQSLRYYCRIGPCAKRCMPLYRR